MGPETHGIRLLLRTLGAFGTAELLGFVVVACVECARQLRRWSGPELVGALHSPWFCLSILREQRRLGRYPNPGSRDWPVGIRRIRGIARPVGLDERGHLFTERDTIALGRSIGNATQGLGVQLIDFGLLGGRELDQDMACGRNGRRLGRGVGGDGSSRRIARVPRLDGIDGVGHRSVHHRHGA